MRLDLPALERPATATSGNCESGRASKFAAPATNSHVPPNSLRAISAFMVWPRLFAGLGARLRPRQSFEQPGEVQIVEQVNLGTLTPHNHILLNHREQVARCPVDHETGREARQHE